MSEAGEGRGEERRGEREKRERGERREERGERREERGDRIDPSLTARRAVTHTTPLPTSHRSVESIEKAGVKLVFEEAMPVGDKEGKALRDGSELFPHLYGGIEVDMVVSELPVRRSESGEFQEICGLTGVEGAALGGGQGLLKALAKPSISPVVQTAAMGAAALLLAFAVGFVVGKRVDNKNT